MRSKTALLGLMSLVLVGIVSIGATLAYLTDAQEVETTFVLGNVKISLEEPIWSAGNRAQPPDEAGAKFDDNNSANLFPGREFIKDPTVTVDSGSEDCYVRVKVTIDHNLARVIEIPEANPGWERTEATSFGSSNRVFYYTYIGGSRNGLLTKNEKVTAFQKVYVKPDIPGEDHEALLSVAKGTDIKVVAQAIQAQGFTGALDAFSSFEDLKTFATKT